MQEMPLEKLLDAMCYPASSYHYEKAWREFLRRYQARMLRAIKKVCLGWRVNRLRMQLDEVVNDVFGGVLNLLIRNDLRALKQFESRDNENRFIAWLTIVSMNETKRELRRRFRDYFSEEEIGDLGRTEVGDAPFDKFEGGWEIYDYITQLLRDDPARGTRKPPRNLERNIHIFFLYTMADFDQQMITGIPWMQDIGHRVPDLVVHRLRDKLRGSLDTDDLHNE